MENNNKAVEAGIKLSQLVFKVSGTKKRHEGLSVALAQSKANAYQKKFDISHIAQVLGRKLRENEGFVLTLQAFRSLVLWKPDEKIMEAFQKELTAQDLALAPIYQKYPTENNEHEYLAAFMIVHRKQYVALEFADEMRAIILQKPKDKVSRGSIVGTAIKISEQLGEMSIRSKTLVPQDVLDAMQLLTDNEVYFISMNFCSSFNMDPRALDNLLDAKGFKVDRLYNSEKKEETMEVYKYYEGLVGFLVSREDTGIEAGRKNLQLLFQICENVEAGFARATNNWSTIK